MPPIPARDDVPAWDESGLTKESDPALIQGDMQTIQNIMWHYVGLVRSGDRLSRAIRELRHLQNEIETFYRRTKLSDGLIGLRNAVEVALIVAQAAYHNRQSRGCHFRADAAEFDPVAAMTSATSPWRPPSCQKITWLSHPTSGSCGRKEACRNLRSWGF